MRGEGSTSTVRGSAVPVGELVGLGTPPGEVQRVKYVSPFRTLLCLSNLLAIRGYEIGRAFWQDDVPPCVLLASGHVSTFTR